MKKSLLVGNGINQALDAGASWSELLNTLAEEPKSAHEEEVRDAKPFTLWFEEIRSRTRKKNLKGIVAMELERRLEPNTIHAQVMDLNCEDVLTTNYDYNLENSTGHAWKSNPSAPETYFSLFRRRTFESKHVWHIHGELHNTNSIMLGHEQYCGYISKIRNFLSNGVSTESKARDKKPYLSKHSGNKTHVKGDVENWVDVFLDTEVHIIGFGLDYSENHLWNLITEKQRLRKQGRRLGRIIFHRCSVYPQSIVDEARLSILRALDVSVVDHTASTYAKAYGDCIGGLRDLR